MLTFQERKALSSSDGLFLNNAIGYDWEGNFLKIGDQVEVVKEEDIRNDIPQYNFCSKKKQGKIVSNGCGGFTNWIVVVQFPVDGQKPETVGCTDFYLRKLQ